jgi:hypothetical protein
MIQSDPKETLQNGVKMLDPVLRRYGFLFSEVESGLSSGGSFASGAFRRDNRVLELHFRHSLGLIRYPLCAASISHEDYMWSVLGKPFLSHYPGFSNDPLDGFRHLALDLDEYGKDFLTGSDAAFLQHIARAVEFKRMQSRLP